MMILDGWDSVAPRLKWHWNLTAKDAERCDACGRCESECTQGLPIIERLRAIRSVEP